MLLGTMGMHRPKALSDEQIARQAHRYGIPSDRVYRMDTSVLASDIGNDRLSQALFQPAQVRVYDAADTLQAIMANCHVGGFPNLKWKRSGWTDRFPPYSAVVHDSTVHFSQDVQGWMPLPGVSQAHRTPGRPAVVLVWSRFLGRQSKRLVRYSLELKAAWPEADWFYVNVDDLFLEAEL